jgi:septal ring-binding cell division protein DamX
MDECSQILLEVLAAAIEDSATTSDDEAQTGDEVTTAKKTTATATASAKTLAATAPERVPAKESEAKFPSGSGANVIKLFMAVSYDFL